MHSADATTRFTFLTTNLDLSSDFVLDNVNIVLPTIQNTIATSS